MANPEKSNAASAAWKAANQDRVKAWDASYRAAHPEQVRAASADWRSRNPEANRLKEHGRRAKKRAVGGKLSKGLAKRLFVLQRGLCPCCRQPLGGDYHMDHIVPLALGGANVDANMQLLRSICNQQKNAKHPVKFMQERGFLL